MDKVIKTLDVNGDGFIELDEIAHVTGLKVGNPVLVDRFHKADTNGKDVQYARHGYEVFILEGLFGGLNALQQSLITDLTYVHRHIS